MCHKTSENDDKPTGMAHITRKLNGLMSSWSLVISGEIRCDLLKFFDDNKCCFGIFMGDFFFGENFEKTRGILETLRVLFNF